MSKNRPFSNLFRANTMDITGEELRTLRQQNPDSLDYILSRFHMYDTDLVEEWEQHKKAAEEAAVKGHGNGRDAVETTETATTEPKPGKPLLKLSGSTAQESSATDEDDSIYEAVDDSTTGNETIPLSTEDVYEVVADEKGEIAVKGKANKDDDDEDDEDDEDEDEKGIADNNFPTLRSKKKKVTCFEDCIVPTSFYGTLKFSCKRDPQPVPFVRLSPNDSVRYAAKFIQHMLAAEFSENVEDPSLIVSVTGGALDFDLPPHLYSAISIGLREVSERTRAWIVSGGTRYGVMKLVGKIMSRNSKSTDSFTPPVIGIATYGIVDQRENLKFRPHHSVHYNTSEDQKPKDGNIHITLDDNHSHFFLVDDGSNNQFGREIEWRSKFEAEVARKFNAPVVMIVVQGGPGTIDTAYNAVKNNTPVVAVEGSGNAADIIAYAYNFFHSGLSSHSLHDSEKLQDLVNGLVKDRPTDDAEKLKRNQKIREDYFLKVQEMVRNPNSVVIYDINQSGVEGLSSSILKAIFQMETKNEGLALANKLQQAMHFGDIARAKHSVDVLLKHSALSEHTLSVLVPNLIASMVHFKANFVKLFLDNGVKLKHLHVPQQLKRSAGTVRESSLSHLSLGSEEGQPPRNLSNSDTSFLLEGKCDFYNTLATLYQRVAKRSGSHVKKLWKTHAVSDPVASLYTLLGNLLHDRFEVAHTWRLLGYNQKNLIDEELEDFEAFAAWHIFIWAVVSNNFELAKMFWAKTHDPILNALLASKIFSALAKSKYLKDPQLGDTRRDMDANAQAFEELAVGVLDECYDSNAEATARILLGRTDILASRDTVLDIAYKGESINFLSHRASVSIMQDAWYGILKDVSNSKLALGLVLCPLFIFLHTEQPKARILPTQHFRLAGTGSDKFEDSVASVLSASDVTSEEDLFEPKTPYWKRVIAVIANPFARFLYELIGHVILCILFSIYLLTPVEDSLSAIEVILVVWFASLLGEEVRQMMSLRSGYIDESWNMLDLVNISVFIAGLVVRLSALSNPSTQILAKAIFSFNVLLLWVRLGRYYAANRLLGPKLIMLNQMLREDMYIFVMLLILLLFGYGVAQDSLLFPDRPFSVASFKAVFYLPFFQIFGEMNLDRIEEASGCSIVYTDGIPFEDCSSEKGFLVPYILALYVLLSSILLVNLLIAMFTTTYERIQKKAEKLWNHQKYDLFLEYRERAPLPGPFVLLDHAFELCKFVLRLPSFCRGKRKGTHPDVFVIEDLTTNGGAELDAVTNGSDGTNAQQQKKGGSKGDDTDRKLKRQLNVIQSVATYKFLLEKAREASRCVDNQLKRSTDTLAVASKNINRLREISLAFRASVERQFSALSDAQSITTRLDASQGLFMARGVQERKTTFYVPGNSVYGELLVARAPLSPEQAPLSFHFGEYAPPEFTSTELRKGEGDDCSSKPFNDYDGDAQINRTSSAGPNGYMLEAKTRRPVNPFGRTGLRGRGLLRYWGVNWKAHVIVTRYKRDETGTILERGGRRVVECLAHKDAARTLREGVFSIPNGFARPGEDVEKHTTGRVLIECGFGSLLHTEPLSKEAQSNLESLLEAGLLIDKCYCHDDRNTDNAWVETVVVNFHDDTGDLTNRFNISDTLQWVVIHTHVSVNAFDHSLFAKLAKKKLIYL